jgi:hypothetical protein
MVQRTNKGQFVKGQSGNLAGRTPNATDVKVLAKQHTKEAVETLVKIMRSPKAGYPARVSAASALLDRGWGRVGPEVATTVVNSNPILRIEFIKAVNGKPASDMLALPASGNPQLPAIVEPRQKLPAVAPFCVPRH